MKWLNKKKDTALHSENNKRWGASFHTRAFKSGGYTVLVSFLMVAAVIAVNLFIEQVPTNYTKLDTTNQKLFTFSQQTKDMAKNLDTNITLYLVSQAGQEDKNISELLSRYRALSDKVTVTTVDPVTSPEFVTKYTSEQLQGNSVIVESPLRNQVVKYSDIVVEDYTNYYTSGSVETSFDGENAITSAIGYVTSSDLPVVYTLTGHKEATLSSDLKNAITKENMTLKDVSLLSLEAVPEDADCLMIYAPSQDLNKEETDKILKYLENGGHMLLITDYSNTQMPNLAALMENYGVRAVNGLVVEGSANNSMRGYPHYLLPNIQDHEITKPLLDGKLYAFMPVAHGIQVLDSYRSTLTIQSLLKTSDSAYAKLNAANGKTLEKASGDISGPFDIGVAVTESFEGKETKLVWFSTSQFLSSDVNQAVAGANYDLLLNSLGYMCGYENNISIRSKSLMVQKIVVPSGIAGVIQVSITILLPLCVIGVGILVFVKRRKR